jgi:hypothetical protein
MNFNPGLKAAKNSAKSATMAQLECHLAQLDLQF